MGPRCHGGTLDGRRCPPRKKTAPNGTSLKGRRGAWRLNGAFSVERLWGGSTKELAGVACRVSLNSADFLRQQLAHAFAAARWQLVDLNDDEYFWGPQPSCWSVRRRGEATSPQPCGVGEWVIDGEWPLTAAPPLTTVAWRLVHLAAWTDVYRDWTFGAARLDYGDIEVPGNAADAVAWLEQVQDGFGHAVALLTDADLAKLRLAHWGERYPISALVWQIAVEHLHHSAETGVLRDLRRGHARSDYWPEPVTST
jgi:hypothetical protein